MIKTNSYAWSYKLVSFVSLFSLALSGCSGGPAKEAKVATAVQTIMATVLEAFLTKQSGSSVSYDCGQGGTLEFGSAALDAFDPLNPPASLTDLGASMTITFTDCKIKFCSTTLTLNGANTTLSMTAGQLADAAAGNIDLDMTITATDQAMTGILDGAQSFQYIVNAQGTATSLDSITILDADPAAPLTVGDKEYTASSITSLVDGC